jgi:chaperonin GroEL
MTARMPKNTKFQNPGVVFQPKARKGFEKGIDLMVDAIRPTLGPLPRTIVMERVAQRLAKPEVLDNGGTIARRIIQVRGRNADMGAMLLRHVLWSLLERSGDGTASAAVLFQSVYKEGNRYIGSGGNAMRLRTCLEKHLPALLAELDTMVVHLSGRQQLSRLAYTISNDPALSKMLGEIFDIIGEYGRLEIRDGRSRDLEREYVEGIYWDSGLVSREMINDFTTMRGQFEDAAVAITDMEIQEPEDLVPLLQLAVENGIKKVLLVSVGISDRAMGILLTRANREKVEVVAVKAPGVTITEREAALNDLAILTGGKALFQRAGNTLQNIHLEDLGHARRTWAEVNFFGIVGGKGDPRALRQHIAELRGIYAASDEKNNRAKLLERLGKLMGGSATLWVGDMSLINIEERKALATRTAEAMRGAMREGVVPGGGTALLDCRKVIRAALELTQDPDEIAACRILIKALEAPTRALVLNAGFDDRDAMFEVNRAGRGFGFDVTKGEAVNMVDAGIYDAASVVKDVLRSAVAGAALALTTDVLIHRKSPDESMDTA